MEVPVAVKPKIPAEILQPVVLGPRPELLEPEKDPVAALAAGKKLTCFAVEASAGLTPASIERFQDLLIVLKGEVVELRGVVREIAK